jgi:hypothetical protein
MIDFNLAATSKGCIMKRGEVGYVSNCIQILGLVCMTDIKYTMYL